MPIIHAHVVAAPDLADVDLIEHGDVGDDGPDRGDGLGIGIDHGQGGGAGLDQPQDRVGTDGRAFAVREDEDFAGNGLAVQGMIAVENDAGFGVNAAEEADEIGTDQGFAFGLPAANDAACEGDRVHLCFSRK